MDKLSIKQILLEQREEIADIFKEKIINREIEPKIKDMFNSNLIKVVTGVRRCGKSVLSHLLLKDNEYGYVNFDDERLIGVKTNDLNDFLEVLNELNPDIKYLLFDEIQNVKGWELFVNRLKRRGYNIIISGSNSQLLSKELATHLTGRHFGVELYPFSFREFLSYKNSSIQKEDLFITEKRAKIKRLFEEYVEFGGFPEVSKIKAKWNYLRELYDKIITRDIILRYNIKYVKDLKEIALYAISNFGASISYHKIKNIFEIKSVHTIKNYLHYLEDAFLLFQVNGFSPKLKEWLKQPKKNYCIDTGLINAIVPKLTKDYGRIIENLVFLELKRQDKEIYFYTGIDYEVDFIIKKGLYIKQLIQVCYTIQDKDTRKREIKALLKSSRDLNCNNLLIITWDEEGEERVNSKKIRVLPLWKWIITNS